MHTLKLTQIGNSVGVVLPKELLARLKLENQRLTAEQDTLLGLLDAIDMPFWLRAGDGREDAADDQRRGAVEAAVDT